MEEIIKLAQRALELAMLISRETTTDAWFEYHGHVNSVMAHYAPGGFDSSAENGNSTFIAISEPATAENLQYIIDCFEFIYAVAERKL